MTTAILGAGLAGLTAASTLQRAGLSWKLFESAPQVGGRVATDEVDGYLIDRGFQVYLPAYPEAGAWLDLNTLNLKPLRSQARLFTGKKWIALGNPLESPAAALSGIVHGLITPATAMAFLPIGLAALRAPHSPKLQQGNLSATEWMHDYGVGKKFREQFARAFFGGVFLDRSLETDAAMMEFTLSMFIRAGAAVPQFGMARIPKQLADALPTERICLSSPVVSLTPHSLGWRVQPLSGPAEHFNSVIVALDQSAAAKLLPNISLRPWCSTTQLSFTTTTNQLCESLQQPILHLDASGSGPVNHLVCMSSVSPSYAPAARALISANCVGISIASHGLRQLEQLARVQLKKWFGSSVNSWTLLRGQDIAHALPRQTPQDFLSRPACAYSANIFLAGDFICEGSIDGAMRSGRLAAQQVIESGAQ